MGIDRFFRAFKRRDFGDNGYPKVHTKIEAIRGHNDLAEANNEPTGGVVSIDPESSAAKEKGRLWGLRKENRDTTNPDDHLIMAEVNVRKR